jgi:hypothetical protein
MGGLATLQQALGARGIQLQTTDEEESGQESNGRSQDSALSRQEVSYVQFGNRIKVVWTARLLGGLIRLLRSSCERLPRELGDLPRLLPQTDS